MCSGACGCVGVGCSLSGGPPATRVWRSCVGLGLRALVGETLFLFAAVAVAPRVHDTLSDPGRGFVWPDHALAAVLQDSGAAAELLIEAMPRARPRASRC